MATHSITVTVDSARNLRAADVGGTSDPFAEVYIGDHRGKPRNRPQKTSTIKHTLNPRWNETLTFHVTNAEISSSSLVVKLMDWDRFTRNDKLGYFVTPLSRVMANPYQDNWFPLTKSLKNNMPDQGSVHLIISVDGKGPGQQTGTGISGIPAGSAAPYQPQYSTQPPYMGGGQPPMQQQAPLPQHSGKYPGLGTTGSSFVAPSPAQPYPPPAGMPGYPPQQPPMQQQAPLQQQQAYGSQPMPGGGYPGMGGYAAGMGGGYPGQRPPGGTGYPPQAPYGAQPPYGQPPVAPPQQGGLGLPAAYIPSFRPQ